MSSSPNSRLLHISWTVVVALALLTATGCTSTSVSKTFPERPVPDKEGRVPLSIWEAVEAGENGKLPSRDWSMTWLLPLNVYTHHTEFLTEQLLTHRKTGYNGLGFPLLLLPIRFHQTEHLYTPEASSPIASQKVSWNPFWASASQINWPEDRTHIEAYGIPLFFGRIKGSPPTGPGESAQFGFWHALWSLGPAYMTFHAQDLEALEGDGPEYAKGYLGMPLALGGPIGMILWFDLGVRVVDEEDTARVSLHGPLFGLLGLINVRAVDHEAGDEALVRLLLSGILWTDLAAREDGQAHWRDSRHGPLWGIVGWGRKNGKANVRLLWIPITLPFQGDPEPVIE